MKTWLIPCAVAALAVGAGCIVNVPAKADKADGGVAGDGVEGGSAASGSTSCTIPQPGGAGFCQASTNLTATQVTSQNSLCTSMQGTVVAACPAGAVGCCATSSGSVDFDQCFYGITNATGEQRCATMAGTWTAGSGNSDAGASD